MNVYTQAIPESVRKLVNAVADDVMGSTPEPINGGYSETSGVLNTN